MNEAAFSCSAFSSRAVAGFATWAGWVATVRSLLAAEENSLKFKTFNKNNKKRIL